MEVMKALSGQRFTRISKKEFRRSLKFDSDFYVTVAIVVIL